LVGFCLSVSQVSFKPKLNLMCIVFQIAFGSIFGRFNAQVRVLKEFVLVNLLKLPNWIQFGKLKRKLSPKD
jgi:hypothetical protein